METFRKRASAPAIASEAAGLRWLAEAGGASVAELVAVGDDWLETRLMTPASPSRDDAAAFGRALAHTHAAGGRWWGAPPPGGDVDGQRLAELPAPMVGEPTYASFGEFLVALRLEPYMSTARAFDERERAVMVRALERIGSGEFDAPQPGLVVAAGHEAARLHGDLWGGNIVWEAHDGGARGTLIDPAAHGGHAESDLAELHVFGSRHLDATIAGYDEVSPLADGWRERLGVHKLHMLLTHVVLFGHSYVADTIAVARSIA